MPKSLIQVWLSTNWYVVPWVSKSRHMPIVRTRVTSDAARATCLASNGLAAGRAATTTEPTSGTTPMKVTHGKALTSDPHEHDGGDDQGGAGEHGQRIGADEPRLIATDPA